MTTSNLIAAICTENRWVDKLFGKYQLFPYIDPSPSTVGRLAERPLFSKILGVFSQHANVSSLLNALAGVDILTARQGPGLVSELHSVFEQHQNATRTLTDRIRKIRKNLENRGCLFSDIQRNFSLERSEFSQEFLPPILPKAADVDKRFVCVSSQLCRLENVRLLQRSIGEVRITKSLEGSGIAWFLCDFPSFALADPEFQDGVVLLDVDSEVLKALEEDPPFSSDIGWYPYVRVYGALQATYSPRYNFPILKYAWMEYRAPKNPAQNVKAISEPYSMDASRKQHGLREDGFWIDKDNPVELLLFVKVMQIMQRSRNLDTGDLPEPARQHVEEVKANLPSEWKVLAEES